MVKLCLRNSKGISINYFFYPVHPKINHFYIVLSAFFIRDCFIRNLCNFSCNYNRDTKSYCSDNNRKQKKKRFRRVGGFVNITDPEGGPTVTSMIPEDGTSEKSCRPSPAPAG